MTWTVATTEPPQRPPTKHEVRNAATLFLLCLALCMLVLVVSLVLLRARSHRRRVGRVIGLAAEEAPNDPSRPRLDPWVEAARRVAVPPGEAGDDNDTVDIDPADLGPEDIEPPDSPHNGTGSH